MMLTLYHAAHSTCSQKVRIVLAEKGLDWESRLVNLARNEHLTPEYLAINPNGVVPTLVHDGQVIMDSSVICEYLDEVFPTPAMSPPNAAVRARMRAMMRFLEEVPTTAVRVPSFNMAFLPRFDGLDEESFRQSQSDIRPLRKHFYRKMGPGGFDQGEVEAALERFQTSLARLEKSLKANGPWLIGDMFSIADAVALPLVDRMADLGMGRWKQAFPSVDDWYLQAKQRPSFGKAFPKGSRLTEFLEIVPLDVTPPWEKDSAVAE